MDSNQHDNLDELTKQMGGLSLASVDLVVEAKAIKFDDANDELKATFDGVSFDTIKSITLGGNSYGTDACRWIAENVLVHCKNIEKVDFSNIFIGRLKADLPISLKCLMDSVEDKKISTCILSHNAFGP